MHHQVVAISIMYKYDMIKEAKTIGEKIKDVVKRRKIPITEFARKINCQRNNVYDIFHRSKIDIVQLKQISKVLQHNFFSDLAKDQDLIIDVEESDEENRKGRAVAQAIDVLPKVLNQLGKHSPIVFCTLSGTACEDCPVPDFGLANYPIYFTIGESLAERLGSNRCLPIREVDDGMGHVLEVCTNLQTNNKSVSIKIDYKTEEEWCQTMAFAFDTCEKGLK